MINVSYTYQILSVNIADGTFQIKYIPEDSDLMPMVYTTYLFEKPFTEIKDENNNLVYQSQDDVPFSVHLDFTVKRIEPVDLWRRQKLLLNNVTVLQSLM